MTDVTPFVRHDLTDVMASVNVCRRMVARTPTTFRPPAYTPTTAWGRHLVEFRRARNWSLTYAFEQWAEGLGMSLRSRTAYRLIEQGKREPNARERAYLVSVVGEPSEVTRDLPQATEPPDALVAAIRAQSETISALLVELQAERQARVAWEQGFLEAMRELATGAARQADPELVLRGDVRQ